jgi:hypothetical protein
MIVTQHEVKSQRELDALRLLLQLWDEHGNVVLALKGPMLIPGMNMAYLTFLQEEITGTIAVIRAERGE